MTDTDALPTAPDGNKQPGWYSYYNGYRMWDGQAWTESYAFTPPGQATNPIGIWEIVAGTFIGTLLALVAVYIGAQVAPDDIYLPVKFVVDSSDLPSSLR